MEKTTTCSPALRFACTSTACVLADSACLPADFLKVRLQLQNELLPPSAPRAARYSAALSSPHAAAAAEGARLPLLRYDSTLLGAPFSVLPPNLGSEPHAAARTCCHLALVMVPGYHPARLVVHCWTPVPLHAAAE